MRFMETGQGHQVSSNDARNRQSLYRFALIVALSCFVASTVISELVAATLSSLLFVGAVAAAAVGLMAAERPLAEHLNRWDEAVALFGLSVLARLFIDPSAMAEAIAAMQ